MNINFGLYSPTQKGEASSSCAISLISDVTLPTRLGLLPSTTSVNLGNITSFVRQFIPLSANTDTGHLVLFQDCGSILLAVGRLDYIVITSYVSQLVNHLRTRTPMGDLVEQSRLALDSHYAYSI